MTDFKTSDRDVNRAIRSWLHEDRHEDVSRVAGAVLDEVETTPQRRATWWPARRASTMNKILGFGLAAAAVVAVVLIASQLLGSRTPGGVGTGTTPTPEPSVAEPSVAEPSSTPEGQFVLQHPNGTGPAVTVTFPGPGWNGEDGVVVRNNGGDPPDGAAIIGPFFGDLYVYGDPCQWSTTLPDTPATTVDDAVAALTAQASRDASAPVDITVDGHAGKSITLHVPDDAVFSECDDGRFASWAGGGDALTDGPSRYHQGPGQIDELWILDVDGELIVVDAMYGAETSAEHLAELHAVLESMTFE